jgi:aryl-alcohol dehydrogenase-like predicted oxidoreductase
MRMKRIGSLEVSVVGLGANGFGTPFFNNPADQATTTRVIDAALDAGVNFIDTAEEYSTLTPWGQGNSEDFIRVALGKRRNQVVLATKFMVPHQFATIRDRGAERIISAVEGSLKRLGTDRIDLFQQHYAEPETPIEEHLEALDRLVRDGKVVEIGCSNFSGAQIDEADAVSRSRGWSRFASVQARLSLLDAPIAPGVIDACQRHGLMLLPYYPLSSGILTGRFQKSGAEGTRFAVDTPVSDLLKPWQLTDERLRKAARLEAFARDHGRTLLELAISWLVSQPFVGPVLAGAVRPEEAAANARAACWDLTDQDFRDVAAIVSEPLDA